MTTQDTNYTYSFSGKKLDFSSPLVMGILNITPDSFFDGGRYTDEKNSLVQVEKMLTEGASIIDIGSYSTRPGAKEISEDEECQRLSSVLKSIRKEFNQAILSIDTFRSTIAQKAIAEGGDLINDISGGTMDNKMFETIGRLKVPYVLMHIQGTPETMQQNPVYKHVVEDVKTYLQEKIIQLNKAGVEQIIIDPGFGFGKTVEHNFELLKNLAQFKTLGYPILAGLSRKSIINKVLGIKAADALNGTSVLNTVALLNGASILRVHDVKEAMECIRLTAKYLTSRNGTRIK